MTTGGFIYCIEPVVLVRPDLIVVYWWTFEKRKRFCPDTPPASTSGSNHLGGNEQNSATDRGSNHHVPDATPCASTISMFGLFAFLPPIVYIWRFWIK